ncbi:hypothetical protein [Acetobacter sp.]|uniref:hypothetical protein n=1 Tax=Acetobacter sp. TaxID=440 RepID=UPI0039E8D336
MSDLPLEKRLPWVRGREWALGKGPYADWECIEAMEAYGYDFESEDAAIFTCAADEVIKFEGGSI